MTSAPPCTVSDAKATAEVSLAKAVTTAEALKVDPNLDFRKLGNQLQAAVDKAYPVPVDGNGNCSGWNCIESIFVDRLVYQCNGELWQVVFTVPNGEPLLGLRTKVVVEYVAETKVAENSEFIVPVIESFAGSISATQASSKGFVWDVHIIKEGKTLSPNCDLTPYGLPGKWGYKDYTAESLRGAVDNQLFDLASFVVRSEDDHLAFQNGGGTKYGVNEEVEKIAGNFDKSFAAETADGKFAAGAKLRLRNTELGRSVRQFLLDRKAEGVPVPYELSWTGKTKCILTDVNSQHPTLKVTEITEVNSVDPVYKGNAGGQILRTSESSQTTNNKMTKDQALLLEKYGALKHTNPKSVFVKAAEAAEGDGGEPASIETKVTAAFLADNPAVAALYETPEEFLKLPKAMDAIGKWLDEKLGGKTEEPPVDGTTAAAAAEAARVAEALKAKGTSGPSVEEFKTLQANVVETNKKLSESHLANCLVQYAHLPQILLEDLKTELSGKGLPTSEIDSRFRSAGKLAAGLASESLSRQTGGRITFGEDQQDKLARGVTNFFMQNASDKVAKAAEARLGYNPKDSKNYMFGGVRTMFDAINGQPFSRFGFGLDNSGRVSEAFSAGISTQLALDAMDIRFRAEWDTMDYLADIDKVSSKMTVNNFLTANIEGLGYFATSGVTARTDFTADYGQLTLNNAEQATMSISDYGNLFYITFKDYINDSVGAVQSIPQRLAQVYAMKRYKLMMDLIFGGHTTTWAGKEDGVTSTKKIFDNSGWGNAMASPGTLSKTNLLAARRDMRRVQQLGSADVMAIPAKVLLFMSKDADVVYTNTTPAAGEYNTVPTLAQTLGLDPVEVTYWDDATYNRWFLLADPQLGSCFKQIYLSGYETPALLQEATGTGKNFTADYIQYKIHAPFAVGVDNCRYGYGVKVS